MKLLDTAPRRTRLAIASSIVIHLCALCVALLLWAVPTAKTVPEMLPVALTLTVRQRPPLPPAAPALAPARHSIAAVAPAARAHPPQLPAAARALQHARQFVAPAHLPATRHDLSREVHTAAEPVAPIVVAAIANPVAAAPVTSSVAHPAPVATAAPPAAPPADGPAGTGGGGGGNPGLFSATYPPAPEQVSALDAIRALLPARMRLRITVDENGHAAVVDWLTPPPDAALAGEIRAKLMALPFIPAECDGLPCAGNLSLTT